ncbi:MAG: ATP-binding cassette domain-containing protein [bacterium]|nr:MAG: ATP-binding cassette domain-containing protein [bacterium]
MIRFRDISHEYDSGKGGRILEGISFSIEQGECVGLTGPSGCGKSTLALIGAGHLAPSSGEVTVNGERTTGRPGRHVFLIHQESDLFPWLRVGRQIAFALNGTCRYTVAELVSLVKLTGFEGYYPNQLSGGMRKRLALARALAINPKLLILDESFGSLDQELKASLFRDLKEIWALTGTTILLITHDAGDLENFVQREIRLTSQKPTRIQEIVTLPIGQTR